MTISGDHPFLPPESERSAVRRLRGRLAAPVTVWTAGADGERAGLTVSSILVADGEPGYAVGVLDPLSELWDALRSSGAAVLNVLGWQHRQLADAFGYVAPAPGGPFRLADWTQTEWGPALVGAAAWAGCRLDARGTGSVGSAAGWVGSDAGSVGSDAGSTALGWGIEVRLRIEHTEIEDDPPPLMHRRGRYFTF